jgi:hypothetical protein
MTSLNWGKYRHAGKNTTPAVEPKKKKAKGGWTHIKQQPVRQFTATEIAGYVASRKSG